MMKTDIKTNRRQITIPSLNEKSGKNQEIFSKGKEGYAH